ncbi:PulJ/GspJ family protein [Bacillus marasmi]|uniref:PulJ/GspJ family protein n=1 Tax=Bacillus marasmi TaxID=1926279 RepID=UPI00164D8B34|nr:prepilin-type N-terminal cleavage/methylation domain-containing protein [Bacillus marasmi]
MRIRNQKGITLVELLATLAISLSLMALISSVLFQSIRSMEVSDTHVNLRQEANLIIAMFSNAHTSSGSSTYDVQYKRMNNNEWTMTIANQELSNQGYNIAIEMTGGNRTYQIDPNNSQLLTATLTKKEKLKIKSMKLIDKNNSNNQFEISTTISRM